jgi:hypothetical protein
VNVEVCLSLDDWGENRTTSWLHHFSVPYDDANTAAPNGVFEYSGPDWTHVSEGHPDDFLGTRSSTTADGASVTIRVPAGLQHYLVAPAGATATVDVTVNDQPADPITLNTTTDRSLVEITGGTWSADTSPDEIVLTRTGGGELRIDGYLGAPTYVGGTPYGNCGGRPSASVTSARASFAIPRVLQVRTAAFRPEVARFRP